MALREVRGLVSSRAGGGETLNIAVFLDGTWSDANDDTNVVQIYRRVPPAAGGGAQELLYIKGVGTGRLDRLRGGILGAGLDDDDPRGLQLHRRAPPLRCRPDPSRRVQPRGLRRAQPGRDDRQVRDSSLRDEMPAKAVFARYRDTKAPGLREMQEGEQPARTAEDKLVLARSRLVRIRFIGVFDTVGRLGIPGGIGRWLDRRRYEFHDTRLSGLVDLGCHAVAVDEHRKQFAPTLWTSVPIPIPQHPTRVEQRWFVGAHGNVGGGGTPAPAVGNPLSIIAREWIVDRAREAGLEVDPPPVPVTGDEWKGKIDDSYGSFLGGLARWWPGNKPYLRPVRTTSARRSTGR